MYFTRKHTVANSKMKQWSPILNISYVIKNKPALVVFTICILIIGITALFTAVYIGSASVTLPNFDKKREWKSFLKQMSSSGGCLKEADAFPQVATEFTVAFPSDFSADLLKLGNKTNVFGRVDITGFHPSCATIPKIVDISFNYIKEKSDENQSVCVKIHNLQKDFFPSFVEAPCTPKDDNGGKKWIFNSEMKDCESSLMGSLNFDNYANNYEIIDILTQDDKNAIYLGLTWIGTISMVVIVIVLLYSILYNRNCDSY